MEILKKSAQNFLHKLRVKKESFKVRKFYKIFKKNFLRFKELFIDII